jgi:hypothetical protein
MNKAIKTRRMVINAKCGQEYFLGGRAGAEHFISKRCAFAQTVALF